MGFVDRTDAGVQLAARLRHLRDQDCVVLGLPRGGVPVAYEVARELDAPLDVIVVRKLGVPYQPEVAFGALGEGGVRVLDAATMDAAGIGPRECAAVEAAQRAELERRLLRYRGTRRPVPVEGRTAVVVDDGIATGSTARAACQVARAQGAGRVVLAVPVAPPDALELLRPEVDELVCITTPRFLRAVGEWYDDFSETGDTEVVGLLARARTARTATGGRRFGGRAAEPAPGPGGARAVERAVSVRTGGLVLPGDLVLPEHAHGVVAFAHGSGSSRLSPRNRYVAGELNRAGLGTLLFDLLTADEEADRAQVFDIDLLTGRLVGATRWLQGETELPIAYFGASTGAAAALSAAAELGRAVTCVVSRGGRPDLAAPVLGRVTAPTLLIVGGEDTFVLDLNRRAAALMRSEHRLAVVPNATHLFEEPGTLESVAALARDWVTGHLAGVAHAESVQRHR
ncbi:phosphoribosyltransferase [Streptomyces sp. GC420]|uniref:phosphoribosyltransferase n=1 Tax=Streptomyces sp. GC420 TaxID=2697568 RepID=UPI001414CE5C|nr:phosphoribosyltransferase [Streptomyces sp. GC420]NBM18777.1 phosphoribosyltransferase [Streptomyces sp. GC420]